MNRRQFIRTASAGAVLFALPRTWADEKPILRIGFMSDTHLTRRSASADRVRLAFETFRKLNVEAIAHLGDLADWHYEEAYAHYRAVLESVYPATGKRPNLIYGFGNHDALNPAEQKDHSLPHVLDKKACFEDMKARLGIDHAYQDLKVIAGYPFLILPESYAGEVGLAGYERKLAEVAAQFPTGPIFLLEHEPAFDTTYNSLFQGAGPRNVLKTFPRVIQFSGHKHASVFNEHCIWQGEFTGVQVSCLQKWYGLNVGACVKGKESYGVSVMEVFSDRLVIRRYDVRGAVEYKPETPWTIPLPHVPSSAAPYAPAVRAKAERPAHFAVGARVDVRPDALPFSRVNVRFPTAAEVDRVLAYRVRVERRKGVVWAPLAVQDVFGDFYERPSDRTGFLECPFESSLFESGARYRFTVTPFGFYDVFGETIAAEWKAPATASTEVLWACEDPMGTQTIDGRGRMTDGWFACAGGEVSIALPKDLIKAGKGDVFRFTADLAIDQPTAPVGAAFGISKPSWAGGLLTDRTTAEPLRYVLCEKFKGSAKGWAFRLRDTGNRPLRVRFTRLMVEKLQPVR